MKVLAANKYYFVKGGAERYLFELNRLLEARGHTVVPFAMQHERNEATEFARCFVSHEAFDEGDGLAARVRAAARILYSREARRKIEALVDDEGVFVGDRYALSYVPSATVHTWLAKRPRHGTARRILLVGDPPYNRIQLASMEQEEDVSSAVTVLSPSPDVLRGALAGEERALESLPRLRGTRDEVAGISAVSEASFLLLGPAASEQEMVRLAASGELEDFDTIHIATHAIVDDTRPERSALVLSQVDLPDPFEAAMAGTRIYDGLVTAKEIVREWELDADLVTLSACGTGLGKEVGGEGYIGFAHAFLQAGARSLIVSLWKVEDTATSLLMRRFYENRFGAYEGERSGDAGTSMSKARALQEAKRWLRDHTDDQGRRPYEHPYFWSAFVLIGDRR